MVLEGYVVCIIYQDIDLINQVQAWCATVIDEEREWQDRDECGPGCPILAEAWKTDDTLRVSQSLDQKEIMVALKIYGIMASSLLLIGLMVTVLGIKVCLYRVSQKKTGINVQGSFKALKWPKIKKNNKTDPP